MPNIDKKVKECDATMINNSTAAGLKKKTLHIFVQPEV
jgi:hypothetical protein